ncbi:putative oxidoreductase YvaA [Rosistilla carotiformis]|uniref:Putative oxidoreductase YvaA n=1 Tax=Rosistilla carotiformis TaxID=2528017 RepID=A0A518JQS7_9BACT|nr:Gfo/Idh/MocA family oxidoreductase [Rosistilla carotiformis]QDV67901.1 putative oxidoreductase YvaA [Rosistilla carotiformis]
MSISRRTFFVSAATAVAASSIASAAPARRRVAVIGHTGRGDFGHGLDTVWHQIPEAEIVAVADANQAGLARELTKLQVEQGFGDYEKMLQQVQPEFVAICSRHADQHHAMALAAIEAGARGLYIEKPICRTPAEADTLLAACAKHSAKIAVAHRNRYHPALPQIQQLIAEGRIGNLLELRGRGKGDHRGGAEDLWVLGSHILNLVDYFTGPPKSCSAVMLQEGRPVTAADVRPGAEGLGPLAGNALHARYETAAGPIAYYDSVAKDGTAGTAFCLQLLGSEGTITIHMDGRPLAYLCEGSPFRPPKTPRQWLPISSGGAGVAEPNPEAVADSSHHITAVRDLIEAVDENRRPLCDMQNAATTVEMICGVFESHRQGGAAVELPLKNRDNALTKL